MLRATTMLITPDLLLFFALALEAGDGLEAVDPHDLQGSFDELAYAALGTPTGKAAQRLVEAFDRLGEVEGLVVDYDVLFRDYPRAPDRHTLTAWAQSSAAQLLLLEQVVSLLEQLRPAFPTR